METKFFNRELSWIEFNGRVLKQALKKELPLMERIQFLSIVTSNFDEFFQVRVASVKRRLSASPREPDVSGMLPASLLQKISVRVHEIVQSQYECLNADILPELAKNGFIYKTADELSAQQNDFTLALFQNTIYPLLTPLRTDTEEFPHISNLALYAAFLLKPIAGIKSNNDALKGSDDVPRIALVQIPSGIDRLVMLPSENGKKEFTALENIVAKYGTQLFQGFSVEEKMLFKVARDAEHKQGAQDLDRGKDLRRAAPQELHRRKARKRDHGIAAELRHLLRRRHRLLRRLAHRTRRRRTNARRRNRALMPEIDTPLPHGCRRHRRKTAHACRKAQRICARQICIQTEPRMRQLHTLHPLISVSAHQSICEPGGVLFDRTS